MSESASVSLRSSAGKLVAIAIAALGWSCGAEAARTLGPDLLLIWLRNAELDAMASRTAPEFDAIAERACRVELVRPIDERVVRDLTGSFRDAGYTTAFAGAWPGGTSPREAGFGAFFVLCQDAESPRAWGPTVDEDGAVSTLPDDVFAPDACADYLAEFLLRPRSGQPRLACYAIQPPGGIASIDAVLGTLMRVGATSGTRDGTIVILAGDGETAPLWIAMPDRSVAGRSIDAPVPLEQLVSTLMELAGIPRDSAAAESFANAIRPAVPR